MPGNQYVFLWSMREFWSKQNPMKVLIYTLCAVALLMSAAMTPQAQPSGSKPTDTTEVNRQEAAKDQGSGNSVKNDAKTLAAASTVHDLDFLEWIITFSPMLLFLILFFTMLKGLGKDFFYQATREKTGPAAVRAADNNEPAPASTSRFVLMLAGISAVITGLCMTTYFFYFKLTCTGSACPDPDFSNLTNVLLALGIGVAPYTIRKLTNN